MVSRPLPNFITFEDDTYNSYNDKSYTCGNHNMNETQTEAVRSMGFVSFLKVDLKQFPGMFSKWLVESFDPYSAPFVLPDGQRFTVNAFDVYVNLVVPIWGREIMEITKFTMDKEYNEVHAAWVKEWKIEHSTPELTSMLEFILSNKKTGRELQGEFIIYLVN
ncbi:hypothetical protein Cgig2_031118 [Carnegiea gigantea]|uniref:Uncharacterized protein n=1 Tax=Carnegiea gigantea TaxID=171969 RepID=A0A9Q1Q7H9_9CARY|nr:hypothetical protein Cgig2_031118 [Carnegiea gigantea]